MYFSLFEIVNPSCDEGRFNAVNSKSVVFGAAHFLNAAADSFVASAILIAGELFFFIAKQYVRFFAPYRSNRIMIFVINSVY